MKISGDAIYKYTWYLNGERLSNVIAGDPEAGWVDVWKSNQKVHLTGTVEAIDDNGKVYRTEKPPHPPARKR